MNRPTIALALPASEQAALLEELTKAEFGTVVLEVPGDLADAMRGGLPIGLAILDATGDPAAFLQDLVATRERGMSVPALIVADAKHFEALHALPGFGADDEVVVRPVDPDAIRWRAEAMLIRSQVDGPQAADAILARGNVEAEWAARPPIVAIFNPKGGVGKTTIATNLAAALQAHRDQRVLLVDADTVTGHITMSLGMSTVRTIADAWQDEADGGQAEGLLEIATVHQSGIRVAALVSSPLAMPHLDAERVAEAILTARWGVDVVVIDLHPSYSDVNQAIFAIADRILVPVTPDLPAIRAAVQLGEVAEELGVRDRLSLVVNRANSGVAVQEIEGAVGLPAFAQIRSAGMLFVQAANEGRTVAELFPKEKISGDFDALADRVLGIHSGGAGEAIVASERPSFMTALFGRKRPASA